MTKLFKNESGFSAVEVLLVILIMAVIGAVGYMVYHNNHKTTASVTTTTSTKQATTAKTTTTPSNPYAGWKTYTSTFENASFQYPSTWTVSSQADPYANQPDETGANNVTVTSPSGSTLAYADVAFGNKPSCGQAGTITLSKVQPLASSDTPTLYLTERSSNTIALADASLWYNSTPGSSQFSGCGFDPAIQSKTHSDVQFSFMSGGFDVPPSALTSTSDLATAELILASLHY